MAKRLRRGIKSSREQIILSELKRRNVIRMAGSYLIGAWLLARSLRA
jgi:hypothetical protein